MRGEIGGSIVVAGRLVEGLVRQSARGSRRMFAGWVLALRPFRGGVDDKGDVYSGPYVGTSGLGR